MRTQFPAVLLAMLAVSHPGVRARGEGFADPRAREQAWSAARKAWGIELEMPLSAKAKGGSGGLYESEYASFPILVCLTDGDRKPVKGAVVVLKRLGPDGWTVEEMKQEAKQRTDENGMMVIHYPGPAEKDEKGVRRMEIRGAVAVIAEGHEARMVELKDFFKDGQHVLSEDNAPVVRIWLEG